MQLTRQQRSAVEATERDVLVIAGAGSGKTRVLIARIRWLLEHGASPADLLVLTFTRKAAGELVDRLTEALGDDRALRSMMLGTFHSVALRILRSDGDLLGYDPDTLTIVTPDDADLLLRLVCVDLGYLAERAKSSGGDAWRHKLSWDAVVRFRERFYSTGGLKAPIEGNLTRYDALAAILQEYRSRLYTLNAMDFGSILRAVNDLFNWYPAALQRYRALFKHVLVDELQDCDEAQFNLHDWFAESACFFGVGDTRQTIYRWRGARPDLMVERHPTARVIHLQDCFRCAEPIVDASNRLIAHNAEPLAKPMIESPPGKPGKVVVLPGRTADIAQTIVALSAAGYAWSDVAVLARTHKTLRRIGTALQEREVPYHRVGAGFDICETDEFKLYHAALRLCVNPRDNLAFLRLVPIFGLTPAEFADIRQHAAEAGISHWAAYGGWTKGHCDGGEQDAEPVWNTIDAVHHGEDCPEWPSDLYRVLWDDLERAYSDHGQGLVLGGELFAPIAEFWTDHCGDMPIADALRWFALRDSQDDATEENRVTLSTVHAAKGLEWPCVLVVELNEGGFPSARSLREEDGVQDERRVAYVAYTRAQERLIVHWRRAEDQAEDRKVKAPSRFLAESGLMGECDDE